MSASTVSITANPSTATRRRAVEKTTVDFAETNNFSTAAAAAADVASARLTVGDASLRAETTRDAVVVQGMKNFPNNGAPRRASNTAKKPVSKHEKPMWKTVIRIFVKNFVLLAFLVASVLLVKELIVGPRIRVRTGEEDVSGSWEMQKFMDSMTKTVKMMQVQVDVIDKKIGEEVGKVKNEVNEKLEGKSIEIEEKLKEFDARTVKFEQFTSELGGKMENWLSKDELTEFLEEFKNGKSSAVLNLDDIREFAKGIVEKEIEKHAADGIGRVDYALASGGAMVVEHSEPFGGGKGSGSSFNPWTNRVHIHKEHAEKMLRPSFGEPGQCFALKGSRGFVDIKLRTAIIPESVTLEHVDEAVAYDRSSAPKQGRVSGWLQRQDLTNSVGDSEKMTLLAEFTYDLEKRNIQTFDVVESASYNIVDTIRFEFTSNHGSATHTCIYRLRVHGQEPTSVSMVNIES